MVCEAVKLKLLLSSVFGGSKLNQNGDENSQSFCEVQGEVNKFHSITNLRK
jgi:hypothetical protein